jgi:hypothetical protein
MNVHPSQTKVALRCADEQELSLLQAQAQSLNLCAHSIRDALVGFLLFKFPFQTYFSHGTAGEHKLQRGQRPFWELQVITTFFGSFDLLKTIKAQRDCSTK